MSPSRTPFGPISLILAQSVTACKLLPCKRLRGVRPAEWAKNGQMGFSILPIPGPQPRSGPSVRHGPSPGKKEWPSRRNSCRRYLVCASDRAVSSGAGTSGRSRALATWASMANFWPCSRPCGPQARSSGSYILRLFVCARRRRQAVGLRVEDPASAVLMKSRSWISPTHGQITSRKRSSSHS